MAQTSVEPGRTGNRPDRNLALELVRVTESAALGAGRWIGRGDKISADQAAVDGMRYVHGGLIGGDLVAASDPAAKISADQAAVDGMRYVLDTVSMAGVVVIGEGEKDEAGHG